MGPLDGVVVGIAEGGSVGVPVGVLVGALLGAAHSFTVLVSKLRRLFTVPLVIQHDK